MNICKWCKKKYEQADRPEYCCSDCRYSAQIAMRTLKNKIKNIAKKHDFELKNFDKIVNAKLMCFGGKNADEMMRCPCDSSNPNRYCGSAQCIADVVYKGHCHCNLFHATKEYER